MGRHSKALSGLGYLVLLTVLVLLSIATYTKSLPWQDGATVTLRTSAPGLELNPHSDVKYQGMRVGEVRQITSDGRTATVELELDPDALALIPANVDAAIVPKTLFGEKFVDLRQPERPAAARLAGGGTIAQSSTAVEIGTLFRRMVPVLQALQPEKLSVVLNSLAQALDGRGATLARGLDQVTAFLTEVDPHLETFTGDVRKFAEVAGTYADAAPDLLRLLSAAAGTSKDLLVAKETDFATLLRQTIATSTETRDVLAENTENLVRLSGRAQPVLAVLDEYSTALPCLIKGFKTADVLGNKAIGGHGPFTNLVIDVAAQNEPYTYPADLPTNPRSDGNNANLPYDVPSWKPHCPQFRDEVLAMVDEPAYAHPLLGQTIDPEGPAQPGASPRLAGSRAASQPVTDSRLALARALSARALGVPQDRVPGYADLMLVPFLADGEVSVR